MIASITIRNARLLDPANDIDQTADLHIRNGVIAGIVDAPDGFNADQTIDAAGLLLIPGIVDLNTRLREPGQEQKGTIISETRAAARGGITTVICPPDTDPIIDTPAVAELIRRRAKQSAACRVLSTGALTQKLEGERLTEMAALITGGCIALSNARNPLVNNLVLRRAMEYAATWDITIFVNPADRDLENRGCVHEGVVGNRLGLPGIPAEAETVAVATWLELARSTGARLHFQQLSTARSVEMIREARQQDLTVTADVSAHHLHLTEMDISEFNANCHVLPPLRALADRQALRAGIADGTLSAICSGHEPHELDAKMAPFPATEPGISSLESLLPLVLKLVDENTISLQRAVELLTSGPAKIAQLPYSSLTVGNAADICLIDLNENWLFAADKMLSDGQNTPFDGWEFVGNVTHTFFEGRLTYSKTT